MPPSTAAANIIFGGNGTLQFATGFTGTLSGNRGIVVNGSAMGALDTNGNNIIFAGPITNSGTLAKNGGGSLELDAGPTLNSNSSIMVNAGTLRLNVSTAPTIGGNVTATIAAGATLQLSGATAGLSQTVTITNNSGVAGSTTGGLFVSGTNQHVGTITGTGNMVVGSTTAPGGISALQIVQNSLVIHGTGTTATTAGAVTLVPSGSGSVTNPTGPNNVNFSNQLNSLSIDSSNTGLGSNVYYGTLDIGNNGIVIPYGAGTDPYTTIVDMIRAGYANGVWTGAGIISTLAKAAADSAAPLNIGLRDFKPGQNGDPTSLVFEGQTVTTSAVLVRLTYMDDLILAGDMSQGDATSDALRFAANYGTGTTWSVGDLNHDGHIDTSDALIFAANYIVGLPSLDGTSSSGAVMGNGAAAVPEPSGMALIAICAVGLSWLARRRNGSVTPRGR